MSAKRPQTRATEKRARDVVEKLQRLRFGKDLPRYISHIRFPLFKNIEPGARIDFSFPVTALVGPNGCGKTSALHALYGAPLGKSTSDYWFSTEVDPIKEGSGQPNRFIYGHWLDGRTEPVETRKARVGMARHRRPGYFEPTKAVSGDKMDTSPFPAIEPVTGQSKDRWNPVDRSLLYMNFRSELSAFDKYLFWGKSRATKTLRTKYDRLQMGAKRLKHVLEKHIVGAKLYGKPAVFENRNLTVRELRAVCDILGKEYTEARQIQHVYYGGEIGLSVRFRTAHATYSEAFAGSGELAVASLVVQLCSAEKGSLVLLDEPEVSLHPGAQERLVIFLMEESLLNKHQVVFTTHSPGLVRFLPPDAIKVFHESTEGRFGIMNSAHPYAAFNRLGAPVLNVIRVLVEDRLAKTVVDMALRNLTQDERLLFQVDFLPGGASTYFSHRIPTLMHTNGSTFVVLDGDKTPTKAFPDPTTIPASEDSTLRARIQEFTGCAVQLSADGGDDTNRDKRHQLERKYLAFLHDRVRFLPRSCPEEIVLAAISPGVAITSSVEAKEKLKAICVETMDEDWSEGIDNFAKVQLASNRMDNPDLSSVTDMLRTFLGDLSAPTIP